MTLARLFSFAALTLLVSLLPGPVFAQQNTGTGPNYETRLTTLEDEMRTLNGQVEQVEFGIKRLDQAVQRMQGDLDARLTKLENAPVASSSPAPANNVNPSTPDTPVNGTLGAVKTQDGKVTGGINNPKSPPLPETPADYGLTPQEQYEHAFVLLRQANYDDAEKAFKTFIDKNPKDKLIDNAKYWYGETLYVRARFDESAAAFADAFQQNPQGSKAPDSLLKLAMSLSALNKTAEACTTLAELKSKYPNAPVTVRSRADEQRTKFKCGAQH